MIAIGEDELICDFAETYQIYDYKKLPARKAAVFASGLRNNSRIKMKMAGCDLPLETAIQASVADRIGMLVWMQSEDGHKKRNRPESILKLILGNLDAETSAEVFVSGEEFEKEWLRLSRAEVS